MRRTKVLQPSTDFFRLLTDVEFLFFIWVCENIFRCIERCWCWFQSIYLCLEESNICHNLTHVLSSRVHRKAIFSLQRSPNLYERIYISRCYVNLAISRSIDGLNMNLLNGCYDNYTVYKNLDTFTKIKLYDPCYTYQKQFSEIVQNIIEIIEVTEISYARIYEQLLDLMGFCVPIV